MKNTIECTTFFKDNSKNHGNLNTAVFFDDSINHGTIDKFAIFKNNSSNSGNISAARFESNSQNFNVVLSATFVDQAKNQGYVVEGTFLNNSQNLLQVLGNMLVANNATNLGFAASSGTYSRNQGAFYDVFLQNGQKQAPFNYENHAYDLNGFFYIYNQSGDGSFADGVFYDDSIAYLFKNGYKIATFTRIESEVQELGKYTEGLINLGTGDHWYFYGNSFETQNDYLTGKAQILHSYCNNIVEGGYITEFVDVTRDYYCFNSCVIEKDQYSMLNFVKESQNLFPAEYFKPFVTQSGHRGKFTVNGVTFWSAAPYISFESQEAYNEYALRNLVPDDDTHIQACNYITILNDVILRVFSEPYQGVVYRFYTIVAHEYHEAASYLVANSILAYNAIDSFLAINPTFHGGPLYFTVSSTLTSTTISAVTSYTPYTNNQYILPNGAYSISDAEGYEAFVLSLSDLSAAAWGENNIGEYKVTRQGINFYYDVNGTPSGQFYLKSSLSSTESAYNYAIKLRAQDWCINSQNEGYVNDGQFKFDAAGNDVFYDANGVATNNYCCHTLTPNNFCCDNIFYESVEDYNSSNCGVISAIADNWGQTHNGRFMYNLGEDGQFQYNQSVFSVKTNYWYCNGTRYTHFSAFSATTCFSDMVVSAADAWGRDFTGRFSYIYYEFYDIIMYSSTAPDGILTDRWYCREFGTRSSSLYTTQQSWDENVGSCINLMIDDYMYLLKFSNNSVDTGRLSCDIITETSAVGGFYTYIQYAGYAQAHGKSGVTIETNYYSGCNQIYNGYQSYYNECLQYNL